MKACKEYSVRGHVISHDAMVVVSAGEAKRVSKKASKIFSLMKRMLPCHPDENNTKFVFALDEDGLWNVYLVCEHFEHTIFEDIPRILAVLAEMMDEFCAFEGYVDCLDANAEILVLWVVSKDGRGIPKPIREKLREEVAEAG
ncbi:MAG: hypothetical protein ACXQT2_04480 [Methanotrichaceae archaeon]